MDKRGRRVPFVLNSTQRRVVHIIESLILRGIPPRLVVLKSRQVGVSTLIEALLFWSCLSRPDWSTLVIAHNMKSSRILFRMSRNFHRLLPAAFVQKKRIDNIHEIEFDSGSRMQIEVQGDPRGYAAQGVHLCFPPDTPILVGAGHEERADSVRVGDHVVTHAGSAARVRAIASRPNDESCVVVRPWLGRAITLTRNHPVFTRRGWVNAGDLVIADEVSMPVRPFGREPAPGQFPAFAMGKAKPDQLGRRRRRTGSGTIITPDAELGFLCGYYLAEGCIIKQSTTGRPSAITFARDCDETGYADRAWALASAHCSSRNQRRHRDSRTVSDTFYGAAFAQMIEEHFGRVDGKRVPDWCWVVGEKFCRGLLAGYLSGDGSKALTPQATVCATSIRSGIAYQMRDLAASLGYGWAAVDVKEAGRYYGRNAQKAWTIRWHGAAARALRELMGLGTPERRKQTADKAYLADGCVWMPLRSLSARDCPEVYDIEVDHPDHSFRTASFAIKNSEFAFYEQPENTLVAVMQALPNILLSLGVIESTANGVGNKFHRLWQRASGLALDAEVPLDERGWTPVFVPWFDHEEYRMAVGPAGLDPTSDELKLMRDYNVTKDQLKWRRWCISANLDGDEEKFGQEYPTTAQDAFMLSGRPAFDVRAVEEYTKRVADSVRLGTMAKRSEIESDPPGVGEPKIVPYDRGRLRIFAEPKERHTYIVGADPSEGDPGSDHSPLAVLDQQTLDFVATWYGKAPPDVLACHAIDLAKHYRNALIINEANNHGILFHETVLQIGYPYLYYRKVSEDSVAGEITEKPGYLSTRRNREHLFNTLRKYVRMRLGKIPCPEFVAQMQSLVYIEGKADAQSGAEKDVLIAAALCLMAHRGDMSAPLEPLPEETVRSAASEVLIRLERDPEGAKKIALDLTGMTCEALLQINDRIVARERRQKRLGVGGMR